MRNFSIKNLFFKKSQPRERRRHPRPKYGYDATILVVDDSKTILYALTKMLQRMRFNTMTAADGIEAVTLARKYQPDLILMDVIMPRLNGFKATHVMRKNAETKHIPIILTSATEQPSEQFWGKRLGANGFLKKPVTHGDLFRLINANLDLSKHVSSKQVASQNQA
jgi:twitching motility two-component system response regulator PilH